ncbi:hypothetical protein ACFSCZ_14180 [Siminovitchia sediminis]|uniref:Uncharacterized protein n=1 Tax=Siminovitchia sediminis TaxID=1274353 RepID=A0ABW4KIN1_9BACI
MQDELQREYNQLIKEISKEVLELSVAKSMEKASLTVNKQVPVMAESIDKLRKVLDELQYVNAEYLKRQQGQKKREERMDVQLKNILQKVEVDINHVKEIKGDITRFQEKTDKKFDLQDKAAKLLEESLEKRADQLDGQLNVLTNHGVETADTSKKLLITTLIFSLGSFGILTTLLLHTLQVISL